ncbi:MAG: HAMP domain-containing sensor histidine kinase, partial [Kiritimatiellae bacterium]|nr:HAMP domain-containing sensor histidine kinase [Kiritimatiellia bacterium]
HLSIRESIRLIADKNKELRQMLHILCHDLANPIGSILSLLEMLDDPCNPDPESIAMMRQMAGSALELIGIVRQMRAIKDGKIRFKLEPVLLHQACRNAQKILQTRFNDKQLILEINVPKGLNVLAEPVALTHTILCNLLTNAAKFTKRGATITIQANALPDNQILCTITDPGIGMPRNILQDLFNPASQTSRAGTANEQGTGFGMPLVKCLIESFGGTIEIESRDIETHPENHGTSIHLYLQTPTA